MFNKNFLILFNLNIFSLIIFIHAQLYTFILTRNIASNFSSIYRFDNDVSMSILQIYWKLICEESWLMQREEILYNSGIFVGIMPADLIVNNLFRENRNVYTFSPSALLRPVKWIFFPRVLRRQCEVYFIHASPETRARDAQAAAIFYVL